MVYGIICSHKVHLYDKLTPVTPQLFALPEIHLRHRSDSVLVMRTSVRSLGRARWGAEIPRNFPGFSGSFWGFRLPKIAGSAMTCLKQIGSQRGARNDGWFDTVKTTELEEALRVPWRNLEKMDPTGIFSVGIWVKWSNFRWLVAGCPRQGTMAAGWPDFQVGMSTYEHIEHV